MNPCKLAELVEAATGLATCEDGGGDLAREVSDLAAAIEADPHYQLLASVVGAAALAKQASKGKQRWSGDPLRELVALAEAVGLEGAGD
jgi:hypothetical protein